MEAMVGGSEDGLVDGMMDNGLVDCMVDNWCRLWHWDDTAADLAGKLHRNLPARAQSHLIWNGYLPYPFIPDSGS